MKNQIIPPHIPTAAMPPPAVLTPMSQVEIKQTPFIGSWRVEIDGVQVSINEWWNWPTREAAQAAVDSLPQPE
jgi:hypothetical protein